MKKQTRVRARAGAAEFERRAERHRGKLADYDGLPAWVKDAAVVVPPAVRALIDHGGKPAPAQVKEALEVLPPKILDRYRRRGSGPGRPRRVVWSRIWGTPDQQAFAEGVLAATAGISHAGDAAVLRLFGLLADYRDDLERSLLSLGSLRGQVGEGDSFEVFHLGELIGAVDDVSYRFRQRYGSLVSGELVRSWRDGADLAPWAFERAGLHVPLMGLSTNQIEAALSYGARLVQHVADDARRKIDNAIFTGVLGRRTNFEIMQELAPILTNPRRVGPGFYGSPMFQAETVLRTEKGRVYAMAGRARIGQLAEVLPGLQKTWLHSGNPSEPRPYHKNVLHGQRRPWKGYFDVNGLDAWGPHDPTLPPEEVIRCGCTCVPYMAAWADWDTTEERSRAREDIIREWNERYRDG